MKPFPAHRVAIIVVALAAALAGYTAYAKQAVTDEFKAGATRPVSVLVMPSQIALTRLTLVDTRVERRPELEQPLTAAIAEELSAKGFTVQLVDVAAMRADQVLRELVGNANRRYSALLRNVGLGLLKKKDIRNREYNLGRTIQQLAASLEVDAIIFSRMRVNEQSGGVRAMTFGIPRDTAQLTLTIVDGTTGDIEAHIVSTGFKNIGGYDNLIEDIPVILKKI